MREYSVVDFSSLVCSTGKTLVLCVWGGVLGSWWERQIERFAFFVVLCGFGLDYVLVVLLHPHCSVYYSVPGPQFVRGLTIT